jgi:hypothetical protein
MTTFAPLLMPGILIGVKQVDLLYRKLCCAAGPGIRESTSTPQATHHFTFINNTTWDARLNSAKSENLKDGPAWPKPSPASGVKLHWQ